MTRRPPALLTTMDLASRPIPDQYVQNECVGGQAQQPPHRCAYPRLLQTQRGRGAPRSTHCKVYPLLPKDSTQEGYGRLVSSPWIKKPERLNLAKYPPASINREMKPHCTKDCDLVDGGRGQFLSTESNSVR